MFEKNKKIIPTNVEIVIHKMCKGSGRNINAAVSELVDTVTNPIPTGDEEK